MHQKEVKPDLELVSLEIILWAKSRYGWFVSSSVSDNQLSKELSKELENLSMHQLNFVEQAKDKWVADEHDKPPNMVEFVSTVKQVCEIDRKKRETEKLIPTAKVNVRDYAGMWDSASDEEKMTFFDRNNAQEIPSATKYWARKFYRGKGLEEEKITELLEY